MFGSKILLAAVWSIVTVVEWHVLIVIQCMLHKKSPPTDICVYIYM